MAQSRKDNKGRVLRKGETQRSYDGKYVYTYVDPIGKRRSIYAKDLMTLREREMDLLKDQLDGLDVYVAGQATLNFVFDRYISVKSDLRATTRTNYVYMYNRFVRDGFGKRKIATVKYSEVLHFYQSLLQEKQIQINTLDIIHTILHPTFQLAVRDDIIRKNPTDGVMAELKKKWNEKGIRHALTAAQQEAFVTFIQNDPRFYHWYSVMIFLLGTGCRVGEAIGIRWKDIDFKNRVISINHSLVYYSRQYKDHTACSFSVSLPKTKAGIREIPLIDVVRDALLEEKKYQEENGYNDVEIDGMKGFVFQNRFGNVHNPQALNRAIKRIYQAYNADEEVQAKKENREPVMIPHFSCHHLRHTFCTRLCENETNIKVIQAIMGHANFETTMDIYAEVHEVHKKESMEKLANNIKVFRKESEEGI